MNLAFGQPVWNIMSARHKPRKKAATDRKAPRPGKEFIRRGLVQTLLDDMHMGLAGIDRKGRIVLGNRAFFARAANSGLLGKMSINEARKALATGNAHELAPALAHPPKTVTGRNGQAYRIIHTTHESGDLAASIQIQAPFSIKDDAASLHDGLKMLTTEAKGGKDGLVHEFAHEARTLLTNMQGFSELILTDDRAMKQSPHLSEWAGFIRESASTMLQELSDMLELVQIMGDDDKPDLRETGLARALRAWFAAAREAGQVRIHIPQDDPLPVLCEKYMLRRALRLVVAELASGCDDGHVEISLKRAGKRVRIRLACRHGREVAGQSAAAGPETAHVEPMGIFGIPLAKAIMARHGGGMDYAEEADGMAAYNIWLPVCDYTSQ